MAFSNNNILEAMLDRATNSTDENVDELAVQIFCVTVRNDPNLIHKATVLLVSKIQSSNVTQSIRALALLEECMANCGSNFQDEISKFRFLNDLIRLVSKKYQGDKTPAPIREKIMDCLLLWTTEYPDKIKIREAYDLLRKEGNDHTPAINTVKRDNIMGTDEAKFCKLLQSKNTEDLKRANLLIQARVNQDARRIELVSRHKTELEEIQNTASLLSQMLDSYEQNQNGAGDSVSLIKELYESCENYLPIMERLPELIDNTNEDLIVKTLEINDQLKAVIDRYKSAMLSNASAKSVASQILPIQPTFKPASPTSTSNTSANTSDLLSDLLAQPINVTVSNPPKGLNTLDELSEIFGKCNDTTSNLHHSVFDSIDLLEPITITPPDHNSVKTEKIAEVKYDSSRLKDIDILSEELLKENLQTVERIGSFKKEPERATLNELAKEKILANSIKPLPVSASDTLLLDTSEVLIKTNKKEIDNNVIENHSKEREHSDYLQLEKSDKIVEKKENLPVVHLADINVDLDDVSPTTEKLLLDDDIKITLNFTSNRPSPNVSVIVVSVTNQSKLPVTSFQLDASVRKPSKVRLLPPTGDCMPAVKPFRPATPINQVMLLLNPTKADVDVTCIVGYKLGDDPDPIKESLVAKNIAYVG